MQYRKCFWIFLWVALSGCHVAGSYAVRGGVAYTTGSLYYAPPVYLDSFWYPGYVYDPHPHVHSHNLYPIYPTYGVVIVDEPVVVRRRHRRLHKELSLEGGVVLQRRFRGGASR